LDRQHSGFRKASALATFFFSHLPALGRVFSPPRSREGKYFFSHLPALGRVFLAFVFKRTTTSSWPLHFSFSPPRSWEGYIFSPPCTWGGGGKKSLASLATTPSTGKGGSVGTRDSQPPLHSLKPPLISPKPNLILLSADDDPLSFGRGTSSDVRMTSYAATPMKRRSIRRAAFG
jgi:hypothetical protein